MFCYLAFCVLKLTMYFFSEKQAGVDSVFMFRTVIQHWMSFSSKYICTGTGERQFKLWPQVTSLFPLSTSLTSLATIAYRFCCLWGRVNSIKRTMRRDYGQDGFQSVYNGVFLFVTVILRVTLNNKQCFPEINAVTDTDPESIVRCLPFVAWIGVIYNFGTL